MITTVTKYSTVVAAKDQVSSDLGGEVAILDLKAGVYYGLDAVGARVWQLVQTAKSVYEIRVTLSGEYDVDPDRCEEDLLVLLQELANVGLVEVSDEGY
jgi:Coenzyme PQQ synthesis protein D (PqqD)